MPQLKVLVFIGTEGIYHNHLENGTFLATNLKEKWNIETTVERNTSELSPERLAVYDACVFYTDVGDLTAAQEKSLLNYVASGKGFVGIHTANASFRKNRNYIDMLGCEFDYHSPYMEFTVSVHDNGHPITKGLNDFQITDELHVTKHDPQKFHTLLKAHYEDTDQPMAYTKIWGEGKIFYTALGHSIDVFKNEHFQTLVFRGIQWSCNRI